MLNFNIKIESGRLQNPTLARNQAGWRGHFLRKREETVHGRCLVQLTVHFNQTVMRFDNAKNGCVPASLVRKRGGQKAARTPNTRRRKPAAQSKSGQPLPQFVQLFRQRFRQMIAEFGIVGGYIVNFFSPARNIHGQQFPETFRRQFQSG